MPTRRGWAILVVLLAGHAARGADGPLRAVMAAPGTVGRSRAAEWRGAGINAVVLRLDKGTPAQAAAAADAARAEGLATWLWIEVGRDPATADAHPEWTAAVGGHHDDWRRLHPGAPVAKAGETVKAWPWVPIGYAPAFDAHLARVESTLKSIDFAWTGVFLNDLQAGPSACGCGNGQCRWALDYGSPATAPKLAGDDAAARFVAKVRALRPGKTVVPVWATECERIDLPGAKAGTGHCGSVPCARGECWPRYARAWNPLAKEGDGPIAVGLWSTAFGRDAATWETSALALFQTPPPPASAIPAERSIAVVEARGPAPPEFGAVFARHKNSPAGLVLAVEPVDQSWRPKIVPVPSSPTR